MKKLVAIAMTLLVTVGLLAACGGAPSTPSAPAASTPAESKPAESAPAGEAVTLTVWGPQEEQELLQKMCEAFAAQSEDDITFKYGVVSEADAKARYSEDPAAAADVFMFANDQLGDLVSSGALYEVTRNKDDIVARNDPGSIAAAELEGSLWAYPMTADNGYFLYYDKSVIDEEAVQTLDGILAAANAEGKKVMMDVSNGWYIVSFFFGAGCELSVDDSGAIICDFNNADGLAAAEAIKAFTADPAFLTGDVNELLASGMGTTIAAGVAGTWLSDDILENLGDNYGATKLPTFTCAGQQVQMSSFAGYKMVGVNSLTASPVQAMDLADWLTNGENQLARFDLRGLGPSNITAAESDAVLSNETLGALAEQTKYAKPQINVPNNFWTPAEAFGATLEAKDYSKDLQTLLDELVAQVSA